MVNTECQSSALLVDNPARYLPKMSSSNNLHDYLTTNVSMKMLRNQIGDDDDNNDDDDDDDDDDDEVDDDDDPLTATSPMTTSDSSDSAIVTDDVDDFDMVHRKAMNYRNSWPKMLEKLLLPMSTTFSSLSHSFEILNQLEQQQQQAPSPSLPQSIFENNSKMKHDRTKYKHPLPWVNSPVPSVHHCSSSIASTSTKVLAIDELISLCFSSTSSCFRYR
jgi:hypothetical protein